jgi:hypothetical protein
MDFPKIESGQPKQSQVQAVNQAYKKVFPSYQLPSDGGIYQSFHSGNVLFLMTDSRTFMRTDSPTLFGNVQRNWLISSLKNAATDPNTKAVIITMTQVWNYVKSAYDWDMVKQDYYSIMDSLSGEKKDIGDTVINNYNFNRPSLPNYKPVMMIVGEHTLAFDDGTWNNFGNFPIAVCGPLDYWQQCRGGPYSHGSFHDSLSQYCKFNVYLNANMNNNICIKAEGVIPASRPKAVDQTVWTYDTCYPDYYKGRVNLKCPIDYKEKLLNAGITIVASIIVYLIFFVFIYKLTLKALSFQKIKEN